MKLVDLFCGTGGFSTGAHRAGFEVSAAFDLDATLTSSFKRNFPRTELALEDVSKLTSEKLIGYAGGIVDGIFGGPPCQGFSEIGRKDENDARRELLWHFFRLVSEVEPTFFVMENVPGLAHGYSGDALETALKLVRDRYAILEPTILDASEFGAATKRKRIFVVGMHKDRADVLQDSDLDAWKSKPTTVKQAIADLKDSTYVQDDDDGFDIWRARSAGRPSIYASKLRNYRGLFTGHRATVHSEKVIRRFSEVPAGGLDKVGRHQRLSWEGLCPTLRAGTGSDRGSYQSVRPLHPDEDRVITVREAARLQGFPDSHVFHPTIWHSFRMIGNSVSPFMAEAIFTAISEKLAGADRKSVDQQVQEAERIAAE